MSSSPIAPEKSSHPATLPIDAASVKAETVGSEVALFRPLTLRGVTLRNRIGVSPMCQYSAVDGLANEWHLAHLASRAIGGAGLVIAEAAAVVPEGRISPADLGIWSDAHADALRPVVHAIAAAGAVPGIQIAHAGRKGSTPVPWVGRERLLEGAWEVPAPSALPFNAASATTYAMTADQIVETVKAFAAAAQRAAEAGFRFLECHFAHGYLVHQFLSPLTNKRFDQYGGDFAGRTRLATEIVRAVRTNWPDSLPLSVRLSCVDWAEGGWTLEDTIELATLLKAEGVDLIDCSSGAIVPGAAPPDGPSIQQSFAREVRARVGIATAAVGGIADPSEAEKLVSEGSADLVLLARAMLRDAYWANHAAEALGASGHWPVQYLRAVAPPRGGR